MAAHRYWALNFTQSYFLMRLNELEFRATVGGADQSGGKTAFADSSTSIYTPDNLIDDSTTGADYWESGFGSIGDQVRVWVDFGTAVDVAEVLVNSLEIGSVTHAEEFDLEYSDDGTTWTLVQTFSGIDFATTNPQTFAVSEPISYKTISFVGGDRDDINSIAGNLIVDIPAMVEGDYIIYTASADAQGASPTPVLSLVGTTSLTLLTTTSTTAGRDKETYIWTGFAASGEVLPEVATNNNGVARVASVTVWRNVDPDTPQDATFVAEQGTNNSLPDAPDITSVTNTAAIVTVNLPTQNDVTTAGPPADYTLATSANSAGSDNHRQVFWAYRLGQPAGLKSIGVWTHTATPDNEAEYHNYTFALRPAVEPAGLTIERHNGTDFVAVAVERYNGTTWDAVRVERFDGTDWV